MSTVEGCRNLVGAAVEGLGGIDVLVNNAGTGLGDQSLVGATEDTWDRVVDTNLKGVFFVPDQRYFMYRVGRED